MAWISSHANYTDFNALPMLKSDMVNTETDMGSMFPSSYTNLLITWIYGLLQNVLFLEKKCCTERFTACENKSATITLTKFD